MRRLEKKAKDPLNVTDDEKLWWQRSEQEFIKELEHEMGYNHSEALKSKTSYTQEEVDYLAKVVYPKVAKKFAEKMNTTSEIKREDVIEYIK
jgi:hypothetical protein